MKRTLLALAVSLVATSPQTTMAQTLLKDLVPGPHPASSTPSQFTNVGGTLFFITEPVISGALRKTQLWKSDGTAANTVMVKDSLIVTTLGSQVQLVASINNTLYYTVASGSSATNTQLWKSDGTTAGTVLVANLAWLGSNGGQPPKNFIVMGSKLYFTFGQNNGRELWVSDGTTAGTVEVINLATGSSSGIQYPGIEDKPMIVYNGKLYFSGTTTLGDFELYSSDGTAAGTSLFYDIRPGTGSASPGSFTIHNSELYFIASNGSTDNLWKTNGTTTTQLSTGINAGSPVIFKNDLYFTGGFALWKTNGTVAGTVFVVDSISNSGFLGANSNYLFSVFNHTQPTPPYNIAHYKRTDGTAAGTQEVSYNLGSSASFNLLADKMYIVRLDSGSTAPGAVGLWVTDGTEAGTQKLFSGYGTGAAYNYNGTFYFQNYNSTVGYEPFYYSVQAPSSIQASRSGEDLATVYPNPSTGSFEIVLKGNRTYSIQVLDMQGKTVYAAQGSQPKTTVSLPDLAKGLYLLKLTDGSAITYKKIVIQ